MSLKAYRLLRNNQEQGPFTAEEIIQKNLKPYDLIWVDGRSAAWNYPGELAEFKMYAPLPGEQSQSKIQTQVISPSVQAAIAMNDTIAATSTQKPRYKVSAAWSRIQTITAPSVQKNPMISDVQKEALKKNAEINNVTDANGKSLSWEEAWLDWRNEKTIPAPKAKQVQASPKKSINESYNEPVLETKYAEPLDSLKDKYIDNILLQKQKTKKSFSLGKGAEFIIPSLALIVIFGVAYWLMHSNKETAAALTSSLPKTQQTSPAVNAKQAAENPVNTVENNNTNVLDNDVAQTNAVVQNQKDNSVVKPLVYDEAKDRQPEIRYAKSVEKKSELITKQIDNKTVVANTPASTSSTQKQFDPSVINNVPAGNTASAVETNSNDLNANESRPVKRRTYDINDADNNTATPAKTNAVVVAKPAMKKTVASYVRVPEYVQMNDGSANLKIQNVSDVNLDLVVVDVQYFDASSRFHKGETLYLHNLKAGNNIVIKTPKDSNAYYATSKVSLVSSDVANVNVIGDN